MSRGEWIVQLTKIAIGGFAIYVGVRLLAFINTVSEFVNNIN